MWNHPTNMTSLVYFVKDQGQSIYHKVK
jgi:hypothetical protein